MKWGGCPDKAAEQVNKFATKVFGVKGVSILLALVAFALLSGASWKWIP